MYNFLFNFYYRYHNNGSPVSAPQFTAILAVASAVAFQVFFFLSLFEFTTGSRMFSASVRGQTMNTTNFVLAMAAYIGLFSLYYNKERTLKVLRKYPENYKAVTITNVFLVFLIHLLPLIAGVFLGVIAS